jgi:hypothetical protein
LGRERITAKPLSFKHISKKAVKHFARLQNIRTPPSVIPRGRIRDIDDHLSAGECLRQTLASDKQKRKTVAVCRAAQEAKLPKPIPDVLLA